MRGVGQILGQKRVDLRPSSAQRGGFLRVALLDEIENAFMPAVREHGIM